VKGAATDVSAVQAADMTLVNRVVIITDGA
jgi:hypothetical protein